MNPWVLVIILVNFRLLVQVMDSKFLVSLPSFFVWQGGNPLLAAQMAVSRHERVIDDFVCITSLFIMKKISYIFTKFCYFDSNIHEYLRA